MSDFQADYGSGHVESPLTREMLKAPHPSCKFISFSKGLTPGDYRRLAGYLREYPSLGLSAYGGYGGRIRNLDFLEYFPFLKRFHVNIHSIEDLDGLRHLPEDLEELGIGLTLKKTFSMSVLNRFPRLKTLFLEGHGKGLDSISNLRSLEDLTLRSISIPDLSLLTPLKELLSLDLKLGGIRDLSALPSIGKLRYLELWMIRGLSDLRPLGGVTTLQYLFLESLKNVKALPPLGALERLRRLHLQNMKGLRNLSPIREAPALEDLSLIDMGHLEPKDFTCLQGHPTLKRFWIGTPSRRKNEAIRKVLPLPEADPSGDEFEFR